MATKAYIRCAGCGARSDKGAEFEVYEPYRATGVADLAGLTDDGRLILGEGIDRGDPEWFYRPELECQKCGRRWTTRRAVAL